MTLLIALTALAGSLPDRSTPEDWSDGFDRAAIAALHDATTGELGAIAIGTEADRAAAAVCAVSPGCPVRVLPLKKAGKGDGELLAEHGKARTWVLREVSGVRGAVVASLYQGGNLKARTLLEPGQPILSTAAFAELERALEQKTAELADARSSGAARPPVDPDAERQAAKLLKAAHAAFAELDFDGARAKLEELEAVHPRSRAARAALRLRNELTIIGKDAGPLEVTRWFQGSADWDDHPLTLVVFWEVWCPHCKREIPKLKSMGERWTGKLGIVGLTKMSRDVTEEQVTAFVADNGVGYPIGLEDGGMSEHFGVKGIPAAAVVKDGKVIWRGHPARIQDPMIEAWLR